MIKDRNFLGILATTQETARINRAWKKSECMNRTEWMKKAINAYAGEQIFEQT